VNDCQVLKPFGTDHLESEFYGVLSLASGLASNVKSRTNVLRLAYGFYGMNRKLATFVSEVQDILTGKVVPPAAQPPTPATLHDAVSYLEYLYRVIDTVYESSRRVGLTNNSLTAGSLRSIRKHAEDLLDVANWIEVASDSKSVNAVFERASYEKASGEIYDLHQVD
jgi:hypothetical protein